MNLILLFEEDFTAAATVTLSGRRLEHVRSVHRASPGDRLIVGLAGGRIGTGLVTSLTEGALDLTVTLDTEPPDPLPATLVLALPRPKVLNRVIAAAASMGVKRICLINAWRVEKSYWRSPRLDPENLRHQSLLGLEQGRDTILPLITTHRFFRRFVEEESPEVVAGAMALVAHPGARDDCPRNVLQPTVLAIGPEGGFITEEIASFQRANFQPVALGPRILRVETAVSTLLGRLY